MVIELGFRSNTKESKLIEKPSNFYLKGMIATGFEPVTVRLEGECSIQLSYAT